jgi:hypothetical protein
VNKLESMAIVRAANSLGEALCALERMLGDTGLPAQQAVKIQEAVKKLQCAFDWVSALAEGK